MVGKLAGALALPLFWNGAVAQQAADAGAPAVLFNSGKPITVPFRCAEADLEWAGLTCSAADPCPVYLELSVAESAGGRVFTAGNIHTSGATLYAIAMGSDDGGASWREIHERIRGAGIDRIQFAGSRNGWIAGQVLWPLAQDPFLLLTTDGGKTWRRQPVFGESRAGSVTQVLFTDEASGTLLFDRGRSAEDGRYELYQTQDGGVTWTIRESNVQPPPLKRLPDSAWRVRADSSSQAYLVERRAGERWERVAAFAVKMPSCAPAEPQEPEPVQDAPGVY